MRSRSSYQGIDKQYKPVYTHQFIGVRLMFARFGLAGKCEAVDFVVAYAPTDCAKDGGFETYFWQKLEDSVEQIPTKERWFVPMDANARTGHRMDGCGDDGSRVRGAYGRDVRNDNGNDFCRSPPKENYFSPPTRFSAHARVEYRLHTTAPALMTVRESTTS